MDLKTPARLLKRFRRDEEGYVTLEALIVMPVLLWLFAACWVYFDAFRQQSVNQKANFVISDMLSRETDEIDGSYVDNTYALLNVLTQANGTGTALRLTLVTYNGDTDHWDFVWSDSRGDIGALGSGDMQNYQDRLPSGIAGDQLILVENWDDHNPVFKIGLDAFTITAYSFTRPRYSPKMVIAGLD
ncbi:TadE/TadG family type IV pilus assembly protein [Primorskyibacter sp. 2E107]|uniref:TadE/TadG family type IV pilus assembly protein n=1 Tax=Primorskyibacter sp. 2E107 TaxID=3403458 RepID=UPI003AF4E843